MKKTFVKWTLLLFPLYALLIGLYLFYWSDYGVPASYQGTAADPGTFMTDKQLTLSENYSRYKDFLFFIGIPLQWLVYIGILVFGWSRIFKDFGEGVSKYKAVKIPIYVLLLSCVTWIINFPLDYISRRLSLSYNISTQTFPSWMKDQLISFWLDVLIMSLLITVLYVLIQRFKKRWWLYAWMLLIPFIVFLMYVQPVVIDPLYNNFSELQDKALEDKILALADKADIPADRVYEVNMSEKTNTMNAYVNGIGSNLRIVLWDTTLNRLTDKEVLFIMAHEMGHYVKHHLYYNLLGSIIGAFFGLYIAYRLLHVFIRKWGAGWGVKNEADIAALPALLLIFSLLSFVASPIELTISRGAEKAADEYAIQLRDDPEAAIGSFQELTVNSLSEVNPPFLVKYLRYGHPTMMERIHMLEIHDDDAAASP
ncbi:M48 family metallopeptidase [Halobacillus salinarum]|uniref:M48 family metallopeptidase n=1 Tax=Halobacillus salinarum TaxID=2932257 RepID=A0ABY4EK11_9BACI|nr:M48 family metallopeptidase [Halobacillus salinarum]UOQ44811.1 M48 family metallopeptidase [Halobacillus salinarum]